MEISSWRKGRKKSKLPVLSRKPLSIYQVFRALIVFRWASLGLVAFIYLKGATPPYIDLSYFWHIFTFAVLYNLIITIWSKEFFDFHEKSPSFAFFDMGFSFAFLTLTGTWGSPFFVYTMSSFLILGLYGTLKIGVIGATIWSFLYFLSLQINGFTVARISSLHEIDTFFAHFFDFFVFSGLWAYMCGLISQLNEAYFSLNESREALTKANLALNNKQSQLLALYKIGKAISSKHMKGEILETALNALKEMGFKRCTIWLVEEDILRPVSFSKGLSEIPLSSENLLTLSLRKKEMLNISSAGSIRETEEFLGFNTNFPFAVFPLVIEDEPLGLLVVESSSQRPLSEEIEVLKLLADQIALSLQRIKLYERVREYAVSQERNRIAEEIHDSVVQNLYGASFLISSLADEKLNPSVKKKLEMINASVLRSLRELRFALLNWMSLEWDIDFKELLERYAHEFSTYSGIRVKVNIKGNGKELSSSKVKDFLRILQESLSNVWRHSQAREAEVSLSFTDKGVSLSVKDEGRGFDVNLTKNGAGMGIKNIKERTRKYGGRFYLKSAPNKGTLLRVWIPY
jgi:signal transduction histidine kinase